MMVTKQFTVTLENHPGTIAGLLETLGNAGINVEGIQGMPVGDQGTVQFITDNPDETGRVLKGAGVTYSARDVLVVDVANVPGAGGRMARALADAGVNIEATYATMGGQVVVGVDNIQKAQAVLSRMA